MKKKLLISSSILLLFISFGFFYGSKSYDERTTAVYIDDSYAPPIYNYPGTDAAGLWTAGANVLMSRYAGRGATWTRNDTAWLFFICGDPDGSGQGIGRCDKYNINTNTWTNIAASPLPLANMSTARLRDSVYTVGGLISGFFTGNTNALQKYDINSNTWTTRATLPAAIGWPEAAGYQDSLIYSIGGMTGGTSNAGSQVYLYNANTNSWRTATSLPTVRVGGGCAISGDTIVYVGGNSGFFGTPDNIVYRGVISQSDRSVITWTTGLSFPGSNRWRFSAAPWGCKGIIISGGAVTGFTIGAPQTYTYSPGANTWTVQASMTTATNTSQVGSVRYNSGIWKYVMASGLILSAPYSIPNTQIFTDTLCPVAAPVGFCQGFNTTTFPPTGWTVAGTPLLWLYHAVSGYGNGTGSAKADFYAIATGTAQLNSITLTSPTVAGDSLIFQDAYCTYINENDQLQILTSTNGGTTWVSLITLNGGVGGPLVTAPPQLAEFTPTANQWKYQRLALPIGINKIQFNAITAYGNNLFIDSICYKPGIIGINNNNGIAENFSLSQNYPNPFNPSTQISFSLPKAADVKLVVFDILGREVITLVNEFKQAGNHSIEFNASTLSSGVYFYRLVTDNFTDTKKMLLIK